MFYVDFRLGTFRQIVSNVQNVNIGIGYFTLTFDNGEIFKYEYQDYLSIKIENNPVVYISPEEFMTKLLNFKKRNLSKNTKVLVKFDEIVTDMYFDEFKVINDQPCYIFNDGHVCLIEDEFEIIKML